MSPLLSRILLAILMLPLAATVYAIAIFVLYEWLPWVYDDELSFALANVLVLILVGVYWCLLWRSSVRWNPQRAAATIILTVITVSIGLVVGVILESLDSGFGWFIWGPVMVSLWLPGTVLIWRETVTERGDRVRRVTRGAIACPQCGYNMTGLRESKCPECGSSYTIDKLLAGQRGESDREIQT